MTFGWVRRKMMRTFKEFPSEQKCILCGTTENKECVLIPIDNTDDGNVCEAKPIHVKCLISGQYQFDKEYKILYRII